MKSFAIMALSAALAACSGSEPATTNTVEDVSANNMTSDEVTEVPDDSASMEPGDSSAGNMSNAN